VKNLRRAFTLVELVFVIMIFGIVAAIASEVYAKIYENYLLSRGTNALQTKTELALEQIAKRLQYRIKSATIATKPNTSEFVSTADPRLDENYKIIEWIGYDDEGFRGTYDTNLNYYKPAWSGFIDVNPSTAKLLVTPGSDLNKEDDIIKSLSDDDANINVAAVIFPESEEGFDIGKFGWYGNQSDYVYDISPNGATAFRVTDVYTKPNIIFERYKLVWTAYAIAPDPLGCIQDCDLYLYWNYQPWRGGTMRDATKKSLLAEHVTTFKFRQEGDVMRLKLCIKGKIVENNVSVCKEKVVF